MVVNKISSDTLFSDYISLVRKLARNQLDGLPFKLEVEYEDLVAAGILGLVKAHKRYDVNRGVKFTNYACHRVIGAMMDYLRLLHGDKRSLKNRDRGKIISISTKLEERSIPSFDEMLEQVDEEDSFYNLISPLTRKQQLVLTLLFREGLKQQDVGRIIGVGDSRVCRIKSEALERLRKLMPQEGVEDE